MARRSRSQEPGGTPTRSFRLSPRILAWLDERAEELGASGNSLAARILEEGLRTERHPLIGFREGAAGVRRPALAGTRLHVYQVIETLRDNDNSIADTAEYLSLPEIRVRACVNYYADFKDEIDREIADEAELARREEERWRRQQEVVA